MSYIPIIVLRITNTKQFGKVYKEMQWICYQIAAKFVVQLIAVHRHAQSVDISN